MKICYEGYLGENHSWSLTGLGLMEALLNENNDIHLKSTNGVRYIPEHLNIYLKDKLENDYDLELSYTAMKNFPVYLSHSSRSKKFGIWCSEFAGKNALPDGFAKHVKSCDLLLPPSNFAKQVFLDSKVPEEKMVVIPHGLNLDKFKNSIKYKLKTTKSVKIFCAIFQPHLRKGIDIILDVYGKAFNKKDDVCLVLKVIDKIPQQPFEVSFKKEFNFFKEKYKNHGEVEVITEYIPNIEELYKACDIHFCPTRCEGFSYPNLEALASGLVNITSNYGGQLDFVNENNSILINGKITFANPKALYWQSKNNTLWFEADKEDAVNKLKFAVENCEKLKNQLLSNIDDVLVKYSWKNVAKQVLELAKK